MENREMEEEITLLDGRLRLWQPAKGGFRTSMDSVFLAAACPATPGTRVLDAGCGVGGAGLCLLWRVPGLHLVGIEWEKIYHALALRNADLNGYASQAEFVCADIRTYGLEEENQSFNHVIVNPPYLEAGCHTPSPHALRAGALGHQDGELKLEDWIGAAHRLLRSKGGLTMIYPASGTDRILRGLGKKFGKIDVIPLFPHEGEAAKRVIVRAVKDRKSGTTIYPGLALHGRNGKYTKGAQDILRGGDGLYLAS